MFDCVAFFAHCREKANLSREEASSSDDFVLLLNGGLLPEDDILGEYISEDDVDALTFESKRPVAVTLCGLNGAPRELRSLSACQPVADILEDVILRVFGYTPNLIGISNLRDALLPTTTELAFFSLRRNRVRLSFLVILFDAI